MLDLVEKLAIAVSLKKAKKLEQTVPVLLYYRQLTSVVMTRKVCFYSCLFFFCLKDVDNQPPNAMWKR